MIVTDLESKPRSAHYLASCASGRLTERTVEEPLTWEAWVGAQEMLNRQSPEGSLEFRCIKENRNCKSNYLDWRMCVVTGS